MGKRDDPSHQVMLDGRPVPVRLRRNARARHMLLRIEAETGGVVVTLPPFVSAADALRMVRDKAGWVQARLASLPPALPFIDGMELPYLGRTLTVRHWPVRGRGAVWIEGGEIRVSGQPEHLARRLRDWLREQARRELDARSKAMAERIGRTVTAISVRDTRSRWGSCSARGGLSFSWRLVLAPEAVMDYVVAHEVAHLAEMNHSGRFWRIVASLGADVKGARAWLRRHGAALHRFG